MKRKIDMNKIRPVFILSLMTLFIIASITFALGSSDRNIIVTANPLWTDTGLNINIGDIVNITAKGNWNYGYGKIGPDGDFSKHPWDLFLSTPKNIQGQLIAFIGSDPYQGNWGNKSFFPQKIGYLNIGHKGSFISNKSGKLWLGINDDAVSKYIKDNFGSLKASIKITRSEIRGDLNNNGTAYDVGDLVLMKRASIGEIPKDARYDLNNNGTPADIGDLVLMKLASVGIVTPLPTIILTPNKTVILTPNKTIVPKPNVTVVPKSKHKVRPNVTISPIPTVTILPTPTVTISPSPTVTISPTPNVTISPTPNVTISPTPNVTAVETPTVTAVETPTVTAVETPTMTAVEPIPEITSEPIEPIPIEPIPEITSEPIIPIPEITSEPIEPIPIEPIPIEPILQANQLNQYYKRTN